MNEYREDDYAVQAAEPEPDPRIVAMHRVVDLEKSHEWAARDAEERQKKAAMIREELSEARDVLSGLLGYPSMNSAKAMDSATAGTISRGQYR